MHPRAVGAVALLVAVVLAVVALIVNRQPDPGPTPDPQPEVSQRTLLVQLRDSKLLAAGSVLLGVSQDRLQSMYWTGDWWVDQRGDDEVTAAELGRLPLSEVMSTVGNQVGVRIDNAWVIDRLAFAGLVDGVGGVRLNLDQRASYENGDGQRVFLPAGWYDLDGSQAAAFVMDSALRDEAERQGRFQQVWTQILRRFPSDPERERTLLVSLGALSKSTMSTEQLSDLIGSARELLVTNRYGQFVLPLAVDNAVRVAPRETFGRAYAIDPVATAGRVESLFDGYDRPVEPVARVNATVIRGVDVTVVREQLLTRGWQSVWGGRSTAAQTQVLARPTTSQDQREALLAAVGVPAEMVPVPLTDAEVDVVE